MTTILLGNSKINVGSLLITPGILKTSPTNAKL